MVKQSRDERRSYSRAKRVLSIQYRLVKNRYNSREAKWHLSTTHNMSLGGVAFFTDQEYKVNDILEIHVVMSGVLDIFKGLAKVVRIEGKVTGAFFLTAVKFITTPAVKRPAKKYTLSRLSVIKKVKQV